MDARSDGPWIMVAESSGSSSVSELFASDEKDANEVDVGWNRGEQRCPHLVYASERVERIMVLVLRVFVKLRMGERKGG